MKTRVGKLSSKLTRLADGIRLFVSAGAFSNIVLDVSKEAGAYGVGVPYAQDRLRLIHELNPHKRLVTAHGPGVFPPPG